MSLCSFAKLCVVVVGHDTRFHHARLLAQIIVLIVVALAKDRRVVVHDEDASGGTTIQRAIASLSILTSRTDILGVTNLDHRSDKQRSRQGEWWENA